MMVFLNLNLLIDRSTLVYSGIEEVIVKNLAANLASVERFDISGIEAMEKVLKKEQPIEEALAQKMFMLHASKAHAEQGMILNLFIKCSKMTILRSRDELLDKWESVARNIFANQYVRPNRH